MIKLFDDNSISCGFDFKILLSKTNERGTSYTITVWEARKHRRVMKCDVDTIAVRMKEVRQAGEDLQEIHEPASTHQYYEIFWYYTHPHHFQCQILETKSKHPLTPTFGYPIEPQTQKSKTCLTHCWKYLQLLITSV